MIFYIDPDSGAITLGKNLDRETAGWHNITVKAVEAGIIIIAFHLNSNCIVGHFIIVLFASLWHPIIVTHQNKVNNSKEQNMSEVDVFPDYCYHQISQCCGAEEHQSELAPRWQWRKNLHFSSSYRALFATAKKPTVITLRSWEIITVWLEVNLREVEEHIAHFFNLVQKLFFFLFWIVGKAEEIALCIKPVCKKDGENNAHKQS